MSDYQVMPPLSADEYAALKADVAAHGVRVPVDVDEHGRLLDGHHRSRIAAELGIECPTRVITGLTDDEKHDHALAVNAQRRQLSREQRHDLAASELWRDPSRSDRAIARLCGVDHKTVGAIRRGGWGIPHSPASRQDAEQITEQVRGSVAQWDRDILTGLLNGASPADVASAILDRWQSLVSQHPRDADALGHVRRSLVDPRLDAVLGFPNRGQYTEDARAILTELEPDQLSGLVAAGCVSGDLASVAFDALFRDEGGGP